MKSLFDSAVRQELIDRVGTLNASDMRLWGKMNSAQMLTHCTRALETAAGITPRKQVFLGKIFTPFIRASVFGEKPLSRNSPTDPTFVVADQRDFEQERQRLIEVIALFVQRGEEGAAKQVHSFFGKLSGQEWGILAQKHLDHHLRQFGR